MTPTEVAILLWECRFKFKMAWSATIGKRTAVQIEHPHIIGDIPANPTAEDEELGADHVCSMVVTTPRPGTIDYNAGPLSCRYWSAKLRLAGVRLDIKRSDVPMLRR